MTKQLTLAFFGQIFVLIISTQCHSGLFSVSHSDHTVSLSHGTFSSLKEDHSWPHSSSRDFNTDKQQTLSLNVTGLNLFCPKSQCHSHYKECILEVDYSLLTERSSDVDLDAAVCCRARLGYKTSHGYELKSESSFQKICHLHPIDFNQENQVSLRFAFSDYEEVIDAELESIECRINSVQLNNNGS